MCQNFISHLKRYISLSEDEVELLLHNVSQLKVEKKDFLLKEGQTCKANYFVEKGLLRMFFINDKGVEQTTQFALENWWIADYMSLTKQHSSPFFIQAIETSAIVCIEHHKQEQLFEQLPQLERYFRLMMQRAYAATQMRVRFFQIYSKEENYRHFVSSYPNFVQRIPQYMLASYLRITPEYLSELRRRKLP